MASALVKMDVHLIFHIKSTGVKMRTEDLARIFIKSDSSKWMKSIDPHYTAFVWQEGYGAFSVSSSLVDKTVAYIRGQAEHHRKRTFREEYKLFLEAYGIEYDERFAFGN